MKKTFEEGDVVKFKMDPNEFLYIVTGFNVASDIVYIAGFPRGEYKTARVAPIELCITTSAPQEK
jgi:hypothetical protein